MRATGNDPSDIPGTSDLNNIETRYFDTGGAFSSASCPPSTTNSRRRSTVTWPRGRVPPESRARGRANRPRRGRTPPERVAPSRQRRGYGRSLLHKLEQQVVEQGYEVQRDDITEPARRGRSTATRIPEVDQSTQGEYELVHFGNGSDPTVGRGVQSPL